MGDNRIEIGGKKFGRLTVLRYDSTKEKRAYWQCRCDCGNRIITAGKTLRSGATQSCGCLQKERTSKARMTHGLSGTRLYRIWGVMKSRAANKNFDRFRYYGARGISVCEEWKNSFEVFRDWSLKNGYENHLTIDRINNDGNYEPSNCRWATISTQMKNRRKFKKNVNN